MEENNSGNYEVLFPGLLVLIIDDDAQLCESLKYYFEDQECSVDIANDGKEGLDLFTRSKFDLVLVDLNMPHTDGHKVISQISRSAPDVPIIVISGTGEIDNVIRAIQLGAWDFITKPILNFEVLEMGVHRALEKVQLIEENRNYRKNLESLVQERTRQLIEKTVKLEKINSELEEAKKRVESADKLKTEFLSQISHEIRTPINTIISFTSLLKTELCEEPPGELSEGFNIIVKSGERIIRTIDLLIDVSQVISGTYKKNVVRTDISELIESLIFEFQQRVNGRIKLMVEMQGNPLYSRIDNYSFVQIIKNLLENSIKFTKQGFIKIIANRINEHICIEVEDTGIGISKDYIAHIFEPFSQEDHGYSRDYEGNGLGMALVKKYCEINAIDISIESEKEKGTKVALLCNAD